MNKYLLTVVAFTIIDAIWLFVLMANFYDAQLGNLARRNAAGELAALPVPGSLIYLVIPLGLTVLVLPSVLADRRQLWRATLFGAVAYATYDLTNLSLLKDWPLTMTIVDIAWGAAVCTLTVWIVTTILRWRTKRG